jgi:hypothetical protein
MHLMSWGLTDPAALQNRSEAMRHINVYQIHAGWFWELRVGNRVVSFGVCDTKERAELSAITA